MFRVAGGMGKGDTLLKINNVSLDDVSLSQAEEVLWKAEQDWRMGVRTC